MERTWPPGDLRAGHRQLEATHQFLPPSPPPPSLECEFYPLFLQRKPFSRTQPWNSNVVLRVLKRYMWLNLGKASTLSFKTLADIENFSFCGCWRQGLCASSVVWNHHLPNLGQWPASFLTLSLVSVYGANFRFHPGIPRFVNQHFCAQKRGPSLWVDAAHARGHDFESGVWSEYIRVVHTLNDLM